MDDSPSPQPQEGDPFPGGEPESPAPVTTMAAVKKASPKKAAHHTKKRHPRHRHR
jgi:hypothetical protein